MAERMAQHMKRAAVAMFAALVVLVASNYSPAAGSVEECDEGRHPGPVDICVELIADGVGPVVDLAADDGRGIYLLHASGLVESLGEDGSRTSLYVETGGRSIDHGYDSLYVATADGVMRRRLGSDSSTAVAKLADVVDIALGRMGRLFVSAEACDGACAHRRVYDGLSPDPEGGRSLAQSATPMEHLVAMPGTSLVYGLREAVDGVDLVELGDHVEGCAGGEDDRCPGLGLPFASAGGLAFADLGDGRSGPHVLGEAGSVWQVDPSTAVIEPVWEATTEESVIIAMVGSADGSLVLADNSGRIWRLSTID
jgi:hypothetical protein